MREKHIIGDFEGVFRGGQLDFLSCAVFEGPFVLILE
jgi:hypothetical protein